METEPITPISRRDLPDLVHQHMDIFVCPACNGSLQGIRESSAIQCSQCHRLFKCEKGIPLLFWSHEAGEFKTDVTQSIKSFYEETPFPNYEDLDSGLSLRQKAEQGIFARLLDTQIPCGVKILEVGCGTGQLSNFLGMTYGRTVFSADMCLNSLKCGAAFKEKNEINNVAFIQMNLFKPVFKPESFDLVICNGVLHHTSYPLGGFQSLAKLVKKNGFMIIGLYNTYGRLSTDIRRLIFKFFGDRFKFMDPRLRGENRNNTRKKHSWFMDQYKNPHESKHTFGEVLHWFDQSGIHFINSIPKSTALNSFSSKEKLFKENSRGTKLDHFFVQLRMVWSGTQEGGLFLMIGQKK